ncbi:hypothetical protein AB0B57_04155 [Micromonospora sp. NPDC049101]|uniref:hypothetical protein n=1 Tax=Micromonospora sp. NPDC049101 TaxID=3155032 RepID=UPI0034104ADA
MPDATSGATATARTTGPDARRPSGREGRSARLRTAIALTWALVVEHMYALVTPPYELGIPHAFHLSFGIAYAWLALRLRAGRRWHRVLLTALLGVQLVGRFFVFAAITDTWVRAILVLGALLTIAIATLLWAAGGSRLRSH